MVINGIKRNNDGGINDEIKIEETEARSVNFQGI